MSTMYFAYFYGKHTSLDFAGVFDLNESLGLRFSVSCSAYYVDPDKSVHSTETQRRNRREFLSEASDPLKSPISEWEGANYSFSLGVLSDSGRRTAILQITEASLARMEFAIGKYDWSVSRYLCEVYRIQRSESMLMGPELEYSDAHAIFGGIPKPADIRVFIGQTSPAILSMITNCQSKACGEKSVAYVSAGFAS